MKIMQHDSQLNNNSTATMVDMLQAAIGSDQARLSPLAVVKRPPSIINPAHSHPIMQWCIQQRRKQLTQVNWV